MTPAIAVTPILAGFPNPVGWGMDKVTGFVGGAAAQGFEMIIGGLTAWMLDAVVWVVGGVFNFFLDAQGRRAKRAARMYPRPRLPWTLRWTLPIVPRPNRGLDRGKDPKSGLHG